MCTYTYAYVYVYIYVYIYRERETKSERERERERVSERERERDRRLAEVPPAHEADPRPQDQAPEGWATPHANRSPNDHRVARFVSQKDFTRS